MKLTMSKRTARKMASMKDRVIRNMFGEIPAEWWGPDNAAWCANVALGRRGHILQWQAFQAECCKCGMTAHATPRPSEAHGAGFELHGEAADHDCKEDRN